MAVTTDRAAGTTAIRPFHVEIPEEELDDLRRRLAGVSSGRLYWENDLGFFYVKGAPSRLP
jgi:hypothetical protein